jgi:two-component system probable response regulator PhcQ
LNSFAVMGGLLPYNNAPLTMYHYMKDALAEAAWRPTVQNQWSQLRVQDHWRIPVDETQRTINLSEDLMDHTLLTGNGYGEEADLVALANECADAINNEHGTQHIKIVSASDRIVIPANPTAIQGIMQRLLEPMSRWAAAGSTLQVNLKNEVLEGEDTVAKIHFETRNCEPAKAMQDCVLFAPALQVTAKRASEFLRASLAIGHMGGSISSPPMQNGYKQIHVTLPVSRKAEGMKIKTFPKQWVQDLSDEYEKWVLGTLEVAY